MELNNDHIFQTIPSKKTNCPILSYSKNLSYNSYYKYLKRCSQPPNEINVSLLYSNLYTKSNYPSSFILIEPNNSFNSLNFSNIRIDPYGELLGNNECGILKYPNYRIPNLPTIQENGIDIE